MLTHEDDYSAFSVPSYENLSSALLFGSTVTVAVFSPYRECQASMVYLPAGAFGSLEQPSRPVVAKNGWLWPTQQTEIHRGHTDLKLKTAGVVGTVDFLLG